MDGRVVGQCLWRDTVSSIGIHRRGKGYRTDDWPEMFRAGWCDKMRLVI